MTLIAKSIFPSARRSNLLVTTALLSLAAIGLMAGAARAQVYFDNVNLGNGELEVESGQYNPQNDAFWTSATDGSATGALLAPGDIGIFRVEDAATLQLINGNLTAAGLTLEGNANFTITSPNPARSIMANSTGIFTFSAEGGPVFTIRSNVNADTVQVNGTGRVVLAGDVDGDLSNAGNVDIAGELTGDATSTGLLVVSGRLDGDLTATSATTSITRLRGRVTGAFDNAGAVQVNGNSRINSVLNRSTGVFEILGNQELDVDNGFANNGTVRILGALDGNVTNAVGGTVDMANGTIDGNLINNGALQNTGTITGNLTNAGTASFGGTVEGAVVNSNNLTSTGNLNVGSLSNTATGTVNISSGRTLDSESEIANSGIINLAGTASSIRNATTTATVNMSQGGTLDGTLANLGVLQGAGTVTGLVTNAGTVTAQGDLSLRGLDNRGAGIVNITSGNELAVTDTITNRGNINVNGTGALIADLSNQNGGTVTLGGGTIDGDVDNTANLAGNGAITGALINRAGGGASGTVTVNGALTVGTLDNRGGAIVDIGAGDRLRSSGAMSNQGTMNVAGTGTVAAMGGLTNSGAGVINLAGGVVNGAVTNNDDAVINVTANSNISGNLINNSDINLTALTAAEAVTLGVGGTFTNYGAVNGTGDGDMRIVANLIENYNAQGIDNVTLVGTILNQGVLNYTQDRNLFGALQNGDSGVVNISANVNANANSITNQGDFNVTGATGVLRNVTTLINEAEFDIGAGAQVSAQTVINRDLTGSPDAGGVMNVNGTLTAANGVSNSAELNIGTAGIVNGALVNSGDLNSRGTIAGPLTNNSGGTANLIGSVTGNVVNAGTLATTGALSVAGLSNSGAVNVRGSGALTSASTIQNTGTIGVAGSVVAAVNNGQGGVIAMNGGTLTGALTNGGRIEGNGTVAAGASFANTGMVQASGGTLSFEGLTNQSQVVVAQDATLRADAPITNTGQIAVAGTLATQTNNLAGGTIALNGGTVAAALNNAGAVTGTGVISGALTNQSGATAELAGRVAGDTQNDGLLTSAGNLRLASLTNRGQLVVAQDTRLRADTSIDNLGRTTIAGTLQGDFINRVGATVALTGGSVVGALANNGTLTGRGQIEGTLNSIGSATLNGGVSGRITNGGMLTTNGTLSFGELINSNTVVIATGTTFQGANALVNNAQLNIAGQLTGNLVNTATTEMQGGTVTGVVTNTGTISGTGAFSDQLNNTTGTVDVTQNMTIRQLSNDGDVTVRRGATLTTADGVQNRGDLAVNGNIAGNVENRGRTVLSGGTITGGINNLGALTGSGVINGVLQNAGTTNLTGRVATLSNLEGGTVSANRPLTIGMLQNQGQFTIGADGVVTTTETVQNIGDGALAIAGRLVGNVVNAAQLTGMGTVAGSVANNGMMRFGGTVTGNVSNTDRATLAGQINGALINDAGIVTIGEGTQLSVANRVSNRGGATLRNSGTLNGDLTNTGTYLQTGILNGSLVMAAGRSELAGAITGHLNYNGGTLGDLSDLEITGALRLGRDYTISAGRSVHAGLTEVGESRQLDLLGAIDGEALNRGRMVVDGAAASVRGNLTNNGTVDLGDGQTNDSLRVGGLSGNGTYRLDLDLTTLTSDRITVAGGRATGHYTLDINFLNLNRPPQLGAAVTLIDVDGNYNNDYTFSAPEVPVSSERIVYSIRPDERTGDLAMFGETNQAIGAIFGNVALVQSLIGSVINRPTSPFVTSLGYEDTEKPCGIGSWGRVTGGHAKATGATDNGSTKADTEVSADYYGMQVGTDLACFDNRFGGWNMAFGVLGGVNQGDTNQPVYGFNPGDSGATVRQLVSVTSSDFTQTYAGLYATATRGRFQADLQYRLERTDFTIENKAVPGTGGGLGLNETDFSSKGQTLSGSLSYGVPLGESGWAVLPTVGFAWSKMSTDSIEFEEGYRLSFKDSTRKIGFVGATLAKTFVQPAHNSALYGFTTATWYKDFANPTVSMFDDTTDPSFEAQRLVSDNLGAYGEFSIGANWVKVLGPKSRGRQVSANARIDARYGDDLDSVGVSGQLRWQF